MEAFNTLRDELFRPIVITLVPGAIAIAPWLVAFGNSIDGFWTFWNSHPTESIIILSVCVIAAGMVIEDIGAQIEDKILDRRLKCLDSQFEDAWKGYLQCPDNQNMVGLRYVRSIAMRLKFELAIVPALPSCWIGLIVANSIQEVLKSSFWFYLLLVGLPMAALYLFFEASQSARNCHRVRLWIVESTVNRRDKTPAQPAAAE